jgi:catechol 2,3-dioxygenase-like lactoylglutathione lyase family enzyme
MQGPADSASIFLQPQRDRSSKVHWALLFASSPQGDKNPSTLASSFPSLRHFIQSLKIAPLVRPTGGPRVLLFRLIDAQRRIQMLAAGKLVGFVPTKDSKRSRAFYEGKLGLQFVSDDQFALVMKAGENMVRIAKGADFVPAQYTVMGWEVTEIEALVKWLNGRGVTFEKYPFVEDQELGIWTAPGGARVAWFKDPDGNVLSLSQH